MKTKPMTASKYSLKCRPDWLDASWYIVIVYSICLTRLLATYGIRSIGRIGAFWLHWASIRIHNFVFIIQMRNESCICPFVLWILYSWLKLLKRFHNEWLSMMVFSKLLSSQINLINLITGKMKLVILYTLHHLFNCILIYLFQ